MKPTECHWHSLPVPSPPAEQHVLLHKSARQSCVHIPLGKERSWPRVAAPAFFLRIWPSSVSNACHHVQLKTTEQQNSPETAAPAQNLRLNPDFPCALLLADLIQLFGLTVCAKIYLMIAMKPGYPHVIPRKQSASKLHLLGKRWNLSAAPLPTQRLHLFYFELPSSTHPLCFCLILHFDFSPSDGHGCLRRGGIGTKSLAGFTS